MHWLRDFYEKECGFTHGVEFVFVASQNSMAALIEGQTLHSFGNVQFLTKDKQVANRRRDDRTDMSALFLRYERLRWLWVDECSTMGLEAISIFEANLRHPRRTLLGITQPR